MEEEFDTKDIFSWLVNESKIKTLQQWINYKALLKKKIEK